MVKIQVLDKGYHPLVGFLPKLTPFYADQNTIGWLIAAGIRKIRYYNADTNKMEDINRNNYIAICNHIFTNPTPAVIQKEVYENMGSETPTVEPPTPDPGQPNPHPVKPHITDANELNPPRPIGREEPSLEYT